MRELQIQEKGRGSLAPLDPKQGWVDTTLEEALIMCNLTREIIIKTKDQVHKAEHFEEEYVKEQLTKGKVLYTPMLLIRGVIGAEVCPLCGATFETGMGALSRKDNKTVLCSECGIEEAVREYFVENSRI